MSMRFSGRDFKKNPLTRKDTQINFVDVEEGDVPFPVQQNLNKERCLDTDKIVSRFFQNGIITHTRDGAARYVDATHMHDFREMMSVKARADQAFEALPQHIRDEFKNDARAFVEFSLDPANLDQLREWGLAAPLKATPEPVSVRLIPDQPPVAERPQGAGDAKGG